MVSLVGNVKDGDFRAEPFPHVCSTAALRPSHYRKLADTFPDLAAACPELLVKNNSGEAFSALEALEAGVLSPAWREFIEYHYSQAFYLDVVGFLGDHMRMVHPHLEAQLGKPLESLTVAPRPTPGDADVLVECQFCINTPVHTVSRVRGVHVDSPKKLFNALLYMRLDEDDAIGGDLDLCRFRDKPRFQQVSVPDEAVEVVDHVFYRPNTLIVIINSPFALHGVTPRRPTPHIRRYFNFLAELRQPIFDLAPYQDRETPWALMAGAPKY
jgi:hypothetical protein